MADIILESFPFDAMEVLNEESSQMEPDREYAAEVFRKYFRMFLSNGVYFGDYKNYGENSMKVTADGGMNIRVAKGAGLIEGADYENTEERIITLERPTTATRIDRIVVQFNASLDTRATKLIVKQGTSENTPAELQRDENIYEICIAEVTVKSTSNIAAEDIVDKRVNKDVCGIVNSLISVDGEELYQQFQEYIEGIKNNLVLKNEDNTLIGKLTVQGGIEGDVKGNVEGNASTSTKLQTSKTITLSGDVTGSISFDGSKNVSIITKLANVVVLTGTITGDETDSPSVALNYPNGYNKDNCVILTVNLQRSTTKGYGTVFESSNMVTGTISSRVALGTSNIVIEIRNISINNGTVPSTTAISSSTSFLYTIVLMKV